MFNGKDMEIIAFRKHRLRFCNSFHIDDTQDAVFYIMSVWQQLAMRPTDILMLTGNPEEPETLKTKLEQFVKNVEMLRCSDVEICNANVTTSPSHHHTSHHLTITPFQHHIMRIITGK